MTIPLTAISSKPTAVNRLMIWLQEQLAFVRRDADVTDLIQPIPLVERLLLQNGPRCGVERHVHVPGVLGVSTRAVQNTAACSAGVTSTGGGSVTATTVGTALSYKR